MLRFAALTLQACGLVALLRAGRAYLSGADASNGRVAGAIAFAGSLGVVATGPDLVAALALASGAVAGLGALSRKPVPAAWFAVGCFVLAVAAAVLGRG